MRSLKRRAFALFALVACLGIASAAAQGSVPKPWHKVLPNGLELFVVENHTVPLATVEVAFRGGAIAQTPENAGLFHLYEHMLFTSNEKYTTEGAFKAALSKMGVANWNGATGNEYINYYIVVPSEKLADGIEFWSWAVKKPLFNEEKLSKEKEVVINEIRGYQVDPDRYFSEALDMRMFSAYPWRKNIDGPESNIKNATIDQLKDILAKYYIPKNTAVFIGGDVNPDEVYSLVQKWFGDWTGGPAPVEAAEPQNQLKADIKCVGPDDNFYDGLAQIEFMWRGPDSSRQTKDTYTSDVFTYMLSSSMGKFKQDIMKACPGLYDERYISIGYPTLRDGGYYYFSTYMLVDPAQYGPTMTRVTALKKAVDDEFALIAKDPGAYFGQEELAKAKAKLVDQNLLSMEKPIDYLTDTLTFWWAAVSTDYFFGYDENCSKVTFDDVKGLLNTYFVGKPAVWGLRTKTDDYAQEGMANQGGKEGYSVITVDNAYWWQMK